MKRDVGGTEQHSCASIGFLRDVGQRRHEMRELGLTREPVLGVDVLDVPLHRRAAAAHLGRDGVDAAALREKRRDSALGRREAEGGPDAIRIKARASRRIGREGRARRGACRADPPWSRRPGAHAP